MTNLKTKLLLVLPVLLASSLAVHLVNRFRWPKPELLRTLDNSKGTGLGRKRLTVSPNGKMLAINRNGIRVIDLVTEAEKDFDESEYIGCLAFSPDKLIANGMYGGVVRVWDIASGKMRLEIQAGKSVISSIAFSPDGEMLATVGDQAGEIKLWKVQSGKLIDTFGDASFEITKLQFSCDGRLLATYGGTSKEIKLWNVINRKVHAILRGHSGGIGSVAFSPDNKILASCSYDGIRLWDLESLQLAAHLVGSVGTPNALSFAPDGRILASGCGDHSLFWDSDPGSAELWDVHTHRLLTSWTANKYVVTGIAFCLDGKRVITTDEQTVQLWDVSRY